MKKLIAIIWLVICLIPIWAAAEEPVKTPAGEGAILALSPPEDRTWIKFELSLQEWEKGKRNLGDKELGLITGQALVTDTPNISVSTDSRIILWDEVRTKAEGAKNQGGGQSMTTISVR
ncbi:MAG: hypothetical protein M0Z64_07395 [Nitrospiraceae bacterium]|nr:hypothetical protein [Nitrospiraceae bacterium]